MVWHLLLLYCAVFEILRRRRYTTGFLLCFSTASTVLFHSGAKHDDLVRLNRLGVSMSPKQMVRVQSEMGKELEGKVNVWKSQIEERKGAELLLEEIKMKQVPDRVETDMEIITEVQVDKNTVLGYNNFTLRLTSGRSLLVLKFVECAPGGGIYQSAAGQLVDIKKVLSFSKTELNYLNNI